jgi:large subunit ribosomal protein L30e
MSTTAETKTKMTNLNRNLRIVVKTGKITVGQRNVLRQLRTGQGKLLIIADNLPTDYKQQLMYHVGMQARKVDVFMYPGSSWDLGNQTGRPYMIGALLVENPGDSKILEVVKEF